MSEFKGAPVNVQPQGQLAMDPRNVNGVPRGADGTRDWSYGLFDCFSDAGTCVVAWFCPCIVYSKVKTRLNHLETQNYPHPSGGDAIGSECCMHCCLLYCGFNWVLQMGTRGNIRNRYKIAGSTGSDCFTACCCTPCELTQESREIELEENALRGNLKPVA